MKIIRWWGLAAFVGLTIILALVWYLLAPMIVKNTLEELGSEALGAKVEIKSVDLKLFPVSVSINHITAANPQQPMENIFESEQIEFAVDTDSLLWKKIIIDKLVLTGVKTATKRETSGEIEGGRRTTQAIEKAIGSVIPDLNNIDVGELVASADLITLKRVDELKNSQSKLKQEWAKALDKEALEKRVAIIKSEYKRLSKRAKKNKINLLTDRKDWKKLKKSINKERKQISSLSSKLKADKKALSEQIESVKNGPTDDMNAIMNKMGIGNGIEDLVDKFIGPQYTPWITKALEIAKSFKPEGGETSEEQLAIQLGKQVYFKDQHIFPEILIKEVVLSGNNQGWELDGNGFDLGYLPWLTGNPAKLNIDLEGKGQAKLNVISDWTSSKEMSTKIKSHILDWPLSSMQFMQTDIGSWKLKSGNLTAKVDGEITLEIINLTAKFSISAPVLDIPEGISGWQKSLATSINNEKKIDFNLSATGTINNPTIKLDSGIEKLFKNAIGDKIKNEVDKYSGKIKQSIVDKVGDLSALDSFNGNFDQWQSQMGDQDKLLKGIVGKI